MIDRSKGETFGELITKEPLKSLFLSGGNIGFINSALSSLSGCPEILSTGMLLQDNFYLRSLEGGPKEINGSYIIRGPYLISLAGMPLVVAGRLDIMECNATTLAGISKHISGEVRLIDLTINTLDYLPVSIGGDFCIRNCSNLNKNNGR
jgi:hypothetical protein